MIKSAVFIDGDYFFKAVVQGASEKIWIDYVKLSDLLCRDALRWGTYYFTCMPYKSEIPTEDEKKRYEGTDKFLNVLRAQPKFHVWAGYVCKEGETFVQKGADVAMATKMIQLAYSGKVDRIELLTGDSDFVPAIEEVQSQGLCVDLYFTDAWVHKDLILAADDRFQITKDMVDSVRLNGGNRGRK